MPGRVVIAGALGLVGRAALDRYLADGWEVVGLSRRRPPEDLGARFISVDLTDAAACREALSGLGATHLVYSALYEKPELRAGWLDTEQMETNRAMLSHCVEALDGEDGALRHITLLQGTKAYGVHLGQMPIPGKENAPRHIHPNFYWLQEDYLRERQRGRSWHWTVLRPQAVIGFAMGSAMNLLAAMGAYAAISRAMGLPLVFPGRGDRVTEVTDARLLASAIAWAGSAPAAQDQIFNVTNGDVLTWRSMFPVLARAFGMEQGADHPMSLPAIMADKEAAWQRIVQQHGLRPSSLRALVGDSWQFADFAFSRDDQAASLLSTIKIRQAGFGECIDSAAMLDWWLRELQRQRVLPP
ncbi:SDR family oxidoreductase [Roseomonas sp. SSH11]|uniref:SDR family oxidoreductase n=1 Tax=Pararoseomonas baculiformis TaxID=2820812 RepID=A0ABS4A9Y2_9PROT|nr:SDR family oxidoreductase [Pararoseomonas baculiformis]MBP0443805.1 SDR family oxidoreductase [Pararoseomonas baculiformis]